MTREKKKKVYVSMWPSNEREKKFVQKFKSFYPKKKKHPNRKHTNTSTLRPIEKHRETKKKWKELKL